MCSEGFQSGGDTCVAAGWFRECKVQWFKFNTIVSEDEAGYELGSKDNFRSTHPHSYFTNPVFHDGQPGEGVGLSRPFTQEEGKYKIQFVTDEPKEGHMIFPSWSNSSLIWSPTWEKGHITDSGKQEIKKVKNYYSAT